uniref:Uncharacterized protein n=1 Tax=Ciona savignyi TaxID=51511 RepID=H2ZMS6_CIOSA
MEKQQPADLPSAENPTTKENIQEPIQDDKLPPRTPKAIKIIEDPIYILSPPATRTRRKTRIETPKSVKTQSSSAMSLRHTPKSTAKSPERDPPPAFIFSPPTTRRRSQRKRIH